MMFEKGGRINISKKLEGVLTKARPLLKSLSGADRVSLYVVEGEGDNRVISTDERFAENLPGALKIGIDEKAMAAHCVRSDRMTKSINPLSYPVDEDGNVIYNAEVAKKIGYEIGNIATFPVRAGERIHGVMQVMNTRTGYPHTILRSLEVYADMLGHAMKKGEPLSQEEVERTVLHTAKELRRMTEKQENFLTVMDPTDETGWTRETIMYFPSANVGGDWYNISNAGEGRIILLGDMAGHGLEAHGNMIAMATRYETFLDQMSGRSYRMGITIRGLETLNEFAERKFKRDDTFQGTATIAAFVKEGRRRKMNWANAGHPAPLHFRNGQFINTDISNQVDGLPLGFGEEKRYTEIGISLKEGDRILFRTDGAEELPNRTGGLVGKERLEEIAKNALKAKKNPKEALRELISKLEEESNGAVQSADDITFILTDVS